MRKDRTKTTISRAALPKLRRLASHDRITMTDMLERVIDEALAKRGMWADPPVADPLALDCDALIPRVYMINSNEVPEGAVELRNPNGTLALKITNVPDVRTVPAL
jgi:hypothetical protein